MNLIILIIIQCVFYFLTFLLKTKNVISPGKKNILCALFQVIVFYLSLLILVKIIDFQLEKELYSFDLNGDGMFGGEEITPEQEEAMNHYIWDTGRALAPITGLFFSMIYCPVAIGIEFFIDSIIQKVKRIKNTKE